MILLLIAVSYAQIQQFECAINLKTICIPDLKFRIKYHDTFGNWNFDYEQFIDVGQHNHITNRHEVVRTNSIFGTGAHFQKDAQLDISLVPSLESDDWTLTFVVMFEEIGRQIKSIGTMIQLHDELEEPKYILGVQIDCTTRHLQIKQDDEIIITSKMRIQPTIWYRVFITKHEYKLRLYVNGFKEGDYEQYKQTVFKKLNVQLENNIPAFNLDALKLYARNVPEWEVIAASQYFQHNREWVVLNCEDCPQDQARKCPYQHHLCTTIELYSFAIPTSKTMGWGITDNATLWSAETDKKDFKELKGTGLCCRDIDYIVLK